MIRTHILKLQWLFSFFCFIFIASGQQDSSDVSILFVGDVMQHGPQIKGAYNSKIDKYEYEHSWKFVQPIISEVDIAIGNLEVTHAGKPYSGYPQFSAPDELSSALKNVGFDVLLTANNHSCDGGAKGVIRTLDVLDGLNLLHTGTFRNKQERDQNYPLIIERNNIKIAILNYTYGTNGIFVKAPLIINYIDSTTMKIDFEKAKKNADYIICTMHWGDEYKSLPNASQKKWEKYCYELGANMVIGSHPHVIQPVERKKVNEKEVLTAYSLGNFVSNQRDRYKNGGMILRSTIGLRDNEVVLKDADYSFAYVHTAQEGIFKHYYVLPDYSYDSIPTSFFTQEEKVSKDLFFKDSRSLMEKYTLDVKEYIPQKTVEIDRLLKGYFAVEVKQSDLSKLEEQLPHMNVVYTYKDFDNIEHYLIGYSESEISAKGNQEIISSLLNGQSTSKIVFIDRFGLKEIK